MTDWLVSLSTRFFDWIETLPAHKAAVLGAAAMAIIGVAWQHAMLPFLRWLRRVLSARLYPILSGAIVIDRLWSLPKYLKAVETGVSLLSNPWLDESQKLTEIFVPVSATTGSNQGERTELTKLFQRHRTFVLIGDPGSGKTTGLKSIALACLKSRFHVPVFVSLRQLAQSKESLDEFIVAEFARLSFPNAGRMVKRLERQGRLVFLLDGLDEVDEADRTSVLGHITTLLERQRLQGHPCHVVVSSRPVGYDEQLRGSVDATVRMADFNLTEIRKFVNNWDFRPPKTPERLLGAITDRRPILEICRNPLMLTIVTSLYRDSYYTLPNSREEFYRVCVEALLRKWDQARNLDDRNKVDASYKTAFLEEFAFAAIAESVLDFRETFVLTRVEEFVRRKRYRDIDGPRFLKELLRSGLLSRLPTGEVLFAHKTLAESLAAGHLRNQPGRLIGLWKQKPDAWLEVCSLFVADPKTAEADIQGLLGAAIEQENWNHLLILAGEAHSCPAASASWILETFTNRPELWPGLDQRAITGLARLGDPAPELLTSMIRSKEMEVRAHAIYALGSLAEPWAIDFLCDLLVGGVDSATTTNALALMGNAGLSVVAALIASHDRDGRVLESCLGVIDQVGTLEALETAIPLLWHPFVGRAAALTCAHILRDPMLRQAFEESSDDRCPPSWIADTAAIAGWALPSLGENANPRVRAAYARIIALIAGVLWDGRVNVEMFSRSAAVLAIPAAILATGKQEKFTRVDINHLSLRARNAESLWERRVYELWQEIARRPVAGNQKLWARSGRTQLKDVALESPTLVALIIFFLSGVFLWPALYAAASGIISWWWLAPILVFASIAAVIAGKDVEPVLFCIFFSIFTLGAGVLVSIARREGFPAKDLWPPSIGAMTNWLIFGAALAELVAIGYVAQILGNGFWICLLAHIPPALWFDMTGGNLRLVFVTRRNPMTDLLIAFETAK